MNKERSLNLPFSQTYHWYNKLKRMESKQIPHILLLCLVMALSAIPHLTCAQNSPQNFLDAHNPSREELGLPPLIWNNTLAAYAQNYSKVRTVDCAMIHSMGPYGENLAWGSWDLSAKDAVDIWVNEKPYYDYNSNTCVEGQQCLHYTQIVWRNTLSVGCGRALCNNGNTFVACSYYPPGNWIGERPYNNEAEQGTSVDPLPANPPSSAEDSNQVTDRDGGK